MQDHGVIRTVSLCLLIVAAATGVYVRTWVSAPLLDGDSPQYMEVAADLADLTLGRLHDRSPGYPLLVMLTGAAKAPVPALFHASLALHGLSVLLLAGLLGWAGVGQRWVVLFCALGMLPPFVEPAAFVMTENLAQFTLVVFAVGIIRWFATRHIGWLGLAALGSGYSGLTRPAYQALGIAIAACLVLFPWMTGTVVRWKDRWAAAGALVLGTLVIVGGLSAYNWVHFGFPGITPTIGFHVSTKTILFVEQAPDEYADIRELLIRERTQELVRRGGLHDGSQTIWQARQSLTEATGLSTPELSSRLLHMNLALIKRAPLSYLRAVAQAVAQYWLPVAGTLTEFKALWLVLHAVIISLWFMQAMTVVGETLIDAGFRAARVPGAGLLAPVRATPTAVLSYLLTGAIVMYTMVITCVLDIGEPRQRRSTDLMILFMCVMGAYVWKQTAIASRRSVLQT